MEVFECLNKDKLYRLIMDEEQRKCLEDMLQNIIDKNEIQLRLYNEIKETKLYV